MNRIIGYTLSSIFISAAINSLYPGYPIDPRFWAILKNKDFIYEPCDEIWQPRYGDASEALNAVFSYLVSCRTNEGLTDPEKNEVNGILVRWKLFKVQFIGIIVKGNKRIFCNFFDSRMNAVQWKTEEVLTEDTAYYSWSIEYDPVSKKTENLRTSGNGN